MPNEDFALPRWAYVLLLLVFAYMFYNMWYSNHEFEHLTTTHSKQMDDIEDFSQNVIASHLWLAKYLIPPFDAKHLKTYQEKAASARARLDRLLGLVAEDRYASEITDEIAADISELGRHWLEVEKFAARRIADPLHGGTNSELDIAYDMELDKALEFADDIEILLRQVTAHEVADFERNRLYLISTAVLAMLLAFLVLWRVDAARRRNAERSLVAAEAEQETAALFEAAFEQSNDAVFLHDDQGQFIRVNQRAREMFGLPDSGIDAFRVRDLHPESELERSHNQLGLLLSEGHIRFEALMQRQDGSVFPGEVSATAVRLDGRPLIQGVVRDLSDIRSSENRYRSLFEQSPVSLWEEDFSAVRAYVEELHSAGVHDLAAYFEAHPEAVAACAKLVRVVDVNAATLRLHGADSKDVLLAGLEKTFTEASFEVFKQEVLALDAGESHISMEAQVRRLDGRPVDVVVSSFLLPGYEYNWSRALVALTDISDVAAARKALQSNQEMLDLAQSAGQIGVWDWDLRDGHLIWTDEVYRGLGLQPGEVTPSFELFMERVHADDRAEVQAAVEAALERDIPYYAQCRIEIDGESEKLCFAQGRVFREAGEAVRMVGTFQDITQRVRSAEAVRKSERHLRQAQKVAHIGSWDLDLVHGELWWSDEVFRMFEIDGTQFA
ncbi:MAG: PAS domain S-box protein, partial [Mariprofundaceae bacterium]|nr:PAS domain S-box protein [Mariprofundaceae bacterium]